MVKIFARLIKNHKTIKSYTYLNVNSYSEKDFYFHVSEICKKLDIATPIIINYHRESYENFNSVKFFCDDFIEAQAFDFLLLENVNLWIITLFIYKI